MLQEDGSHRGDAKEGFAATCRRARILDQTGLTMTLRYGHSRVGDLQDEIAEVAQNRPQERLIDLPEEAKRTVRDEGRELQNPR